MVLVLFYLIINFSMQVKTGIIPSYRCVNWGPGKLTCQRSGNKWSVQPGLTHIYLLALVITLCLQVREANFIWGSSRHTLPLLRGPGVRPGSVGQCLLLFSTVYVMSYFIDGFFSGESKKMGVRWRGKMAADSFRLVSFQLGIPVKIDNLASLCSNLKFHGRTLIAALNQMLIFWSLSTLARRQMT